MCSLVITHWLIRTFINYGQRVIRVSALELCPSRCMCVCACDERDFVCARAVPMHMWIRIVYSFSWIINSRYVSYTQNRTKPAKTALKSNNSIFDIFFSYWANDLLAAIFDAGFSMFNCSTFSSPQLPKPSNFKIPKVWLRIWVPRWNWWHPTYWTIIEHMRYSNACCSHRPNYRNSRHSNWMPKVSNC